ncbi:MAG TPA: helix-turn-helix domain-containing protein [Edaphocola sp.]|nr:helix-turn-helix domain-containing protein [Edaphocola sp.]
MEQKESIREFYQRIDCTKIEANRHMPHINIFERDSCSVQIPYSRRDYYKVTLILGKGRIEYADKTFKIQQPALLFSNPLIPYAWIPESEDQKGWFCIFNDAFVKQHDRLLIDLPMFQPGNGHIFFPNQEQTLKISDFFDKMMKEKQECYEYKSDILRSYLHLVVHEGLKMQPGNISEQATSAGTRITNLFLELLERQFPVESMQNSLQLTTAKDYASRLAVHVNHLNRSVKEVTGRTTTEHIGNRIALEAQALIRHSNWTISEIAYSLGFEYPAHFTSFYKKKTGQTPASLRRGIV